MFICSKNVWLQVVCMQSINRIRAYIVAYPFTYLRFTANSAILIIFF
jgi:hypothetical protein